LGSPNTSFEVIKAPDGSIWAACLGDAACDGPLFHHHDNLVNTYSSTNGLASSPLTTLYVTPQGVVWTAHQNGQFSRFSQGSWTILTPTIQTMGTAAQTITQAGDGTMWFASQAAGWLFSYDGTTWTSYGSIDAANSTIQRLQTGADGSVWAGGWGGLFHRVGATWQKITGLPDGANEDLPLLVDSNGRLWISLYNMNASSASLASFDGSIWSFYNLGTNSQRIYSATETPEGKIMVGPNIKILDEGRFFNQQLPVTASSSRNAIAFSEDGSLWVAGNILTGGPTTYGLFVRWQGNTFTFPDGEWLSETQYRTSMPINALMPVGDYRVVVNDADGSDGMQAPPTTGLTFKIDYAGQVTDADRVKPAMPGLWASGVEGAASSLTIKLTPGDSSNLTSYFYSVCSSSGASDIISWTEAQVIAPDLKLTVNLVNLGLVQGHTYWVTARVMNRGGILSEPQAVEFTSGVLTRFYSFLPAMKR
jgi:streptogramin lyase